MAATKVKVERDIIASLHQLWYWDLNNFLYCYIVFSGNVIMMLHWLITFSIRLTSQSSWYVIVFMGNIIMSLTLHWLITFSIRLTSQSVDVLLFFYGQHHVFDVTLTDNFQYQTQSQLLTISPSKIKGISVYITDKDDYLAIHFVWSFLMFFSCIVNGCLGI